jgi:hypothetical protein
MLLSIYGCFSLQAEQGSGAVGIAGTHRFIFSNINCIVLFRYLTVYGTKRGEDPFQDLQNENNDSQFNRIKMMPKLDE